MAPTKPELKRLQHTWLRCLIVLTALRPPVHASDINLADLSLEELMNIKVTLASRHPEKISQVPAAIHAFTEDDLRRIGGHTLPEALRLVRDQTDDSFAISVTPANRTTHLWSGFVQTDISLRPERPRTGARVKGGAQQLYGL